MQTYDDEEFFNENIENINHLTTIILFCMNAVIPLLYVFTKIGLFHPPLKLLKYIEIFVFCFTFILCGIVFGITHKSKNNYTTLTINKWQHIAMYCGLIVTNIVIAVMATQTHIGIYISWALLIYLSCLYYNVKLTSCMCIIGYVLLVISQYFKSGNRVAEGLTENTQVYDWLAFTAGYTIEWIFVSMISISIAKRSHKTLENAISKNEQFKQSQYDLMHFVPNILKQHEIITGCHVKHTVEYVEMICNELRREGLYIEELTEQNIKMFSAAANLHDIGKIYIPDHILNKPGKYTPEEYKMMQVHPEKGKEILETMPKIDDGTYNKIAIDMCYCHHEKWDGTGYPRKIAGKEIPLCARIMSVADVLDALLSFRPYKNEMDIDDALKILIGAKGTQFEPCIVDAAVNLKPLIFACSQSFKMNEEEDIKKEVAWREQERQSLYHGVTVSESLQKEIEHNS